MTNATAYRVARVIAECLAMDQDLLPVDPDPVTEDSLEKVEIGMGLEEEFDLDDIPDDDMEDVKTLGDWVDLVECKLSGKQHSSSSFSL